MQKTVRVTGRANLSIAPDTAVVTIMLRGTAKEYEQIIKKSSGDLKKVKKAIFDLGFEEKALKNIDYDVKMDYEGTTDKKGNYKRAFVGYKYYREMKLTFTKDAKLLGKLMTALQLCSAAPEISIYYTVADTEAAKNQLLDLAVKDAICKAQALSKGANVVLGDIISIDYSFIKIHFDTEICAVSEKCMCFDEESDDLDFDLDPEDIDAKDSVTVVFEIK